MDEDKLSADEWKEFLSKQAEPYVYKDPRRLRKDIELEKNGRIPEIINAHFKNSKDKSKVNILEAGCGSAKRSFTLALLGYSTSGLDYSAQIIKSLEKNLQMVESLYGKTTFSPVKGDLFDIPFSDNTFDVVFNEGVLEHFLERETRIKALKEMKRILKENGMVIVVVPNGKHFMMKFWYFFRYPGYINAEKWHFYSPNELKSEFEEAGLTNVKIAGFEKTPWLFLNLWPRFILFGLIAEFLRITLKIKENSNTKLNINILGSGIKS